IKNNCSDGTIYPGSALSLGGSVSVVNCLFSGNGTPAVGASGAPPGINTVIAMINTVIVGNQEEYYGGIWADDANLIVLNSLIWDNRGSFLTDEPNQIFGTTSASFDIRNSCIQGWTGSFGGVGNHGNDPRFIDADGPDNIYG